MYLYAINVNIYNAYIYLYLQIDRQIDRYNVNNTAAVGTMISVIVAVTIYWV